MPDRFPNNSSQAIQTDAACGLGDELEIAKTVFSHGRQRARGFFCLTT